MHIQSCENPKRIYNKYLREYMYVPCGTCNTCRIKKASRWVQRLQIESECHSYSVFFTLTYDQTNVPTVSFDDSIHCILPVRNTDCSFDLEDCIEFSEDNESCKLMSSSEFYILQSADAQKFIKRLRYFIDEKYKETKEGVPSIRYYVVGEYGPTTYRPHMHGILWFDDSRLARDFDELFTKSWSKFNRVEKSFCPIGRTDWSFVNSSAASYVAQYVNCTTHLPKILATGKIRPFSLCSRRPPIGSLLQSSESISEIFHQGLVQTCVPQTGGKPPLITPLLSSLRNRLFPKCLRFGKISHPLRIAVYRLAERLPAQAFDVDREAYEEIIRNFVFDKIKDSNNYLDMYMCELSENYKDFTSIYRAFDISKRVMAQREIFGCSLDYYVSRIELYYDNVAAYNLSSWFTFCEEYSKSNCYLDLFSADCEFSDSWYNDELSQEMLDYYGIKSLSFNDGLRYFDYSCNKDYKDMKFTSFKILKDTTKTKKKNDYYSVRL